MSLLQNMPDPVQWFEGMLLSPQHFQQNNIYLEQMMFQQLQQTRPFYWGVNSLEIDEDALSYDRLVVAVVQAVMPDGTMVKHGVAANEQPGQSASHDHGNLSIDLKALQDIEPQKPFYIHLAVAKLSDACASDVESELKRYDSVNVGKVIDQNDMQNQVDLVRMRTRLHLLADNQLSPNYSSFPLFKIEKSYDGSFQLLNYTPPVLKVTRTNAPFQVKLGKTIESLLGDVRTKATGLRNFFTDTHEKSNVVGSMQKRRIHYMTAQLPSIEVMLNSHVSHPYDLYVALVRMAGSMGVMHPDMIPPAFSEYQHNNLDATYKGLFEFIQDITDSIRLDFTYIPFAVNENNEYSVPVDALPEDGVFYVSCKQSQGSSREMLQEWMQSALIASGEVWDRLLVTRTLGAERVKVSEFANLKLIESDDEVFFEVHVDPDIVKENDSLLISGSDHSLQEHMPATINWIVPRKTTK